MAGNTGYTPIENNDEFGFDQINDALGVLDAQLTGSVATASALPVSGNWTSRSIMALDTGTIWVRNRANTGWLPYDTEWQTWTPSVANLSVGNGAQVARTLRQGKTCFGYYEFTLGSTSAFNASSTPSIPVPFAARVTSKLSKIGTGWAADVSAGVYAEMSPFLDAAGAVIAPYPMAAGGPYVTLTGTFATAPFTWAVSDYFTLHFRYELA